ncbi:MAG TPA: ribose-5-phosphate isomerase RpiA [Chlamydiales bacterium]|nr:ribose-5-phosphate isomerase RpiA [Chlamydiales bacterium]
MSFSQNVPKVIQNLAFGTNVMQELAKESAARIAADAIDNGHIVGLGSGTTVAHFIKILADRCKSGLRIQAVSSSRHSTDLARKGGIEIVDINSVPRIDITVDGADEIDPKKRMIKGRGGAHVREKILASSSNEMVVIIDETKMVANLGMGPLPIEILFYGSPATRQKIENLGFAGKWRMNEDGTLFVSENGNLILNISFDSPLSDPESEHAKLIQIPGVVDTGFFFNLAGNVIVGYENGTTKTW